MSLIDVIWSADYEGCFIAKRNTTLLPPWADSVLNGESAVQNICQDFFTSAVWEEWIGDDPDWTITLEIHTPPSIAGSYEVELERVTKASAKRRAA